MVFVLRYNVSFDRPSILETLAPACRARVRPPAPREGGRMDALELLKYDHEKLKELFNQAEGTEQSEKKEIFKQIKRDLEAHVRIEDGIFYPAIEHHEQLKDMVLESYRKHKDVKVLLREIDGLVSQNKPLEPKLKILKETVEHRNDEEERKIFLHVRELVDDETLEKLGRQFQVARNRLL
jgi:hypothetical protein